MSRRITLAAACAAVLMVASVFASPSADAVSAEHDGSTFTLAVFPHATTAVSFWDSWGAPRSGGRRHQGTDIMSPQGTEVVAVSDGVIDELGRHRMSGYFIRIDHGDGWKTTYMHLNNDTPGTNDGAGGALTAFAPGLRVGQQVVAGDVIGYVGNSGNAEGKRHHTHFEIRHYRKKLNPHPLLVDALKRQRRRPAGVLPF